MTPRVEEVMKRQLEAFRKKFGRDPGPDEPVFFDPDEDEPTPMRNPQAQVLAAMEKANLPPEIAYAYSMGELRPHARRDAPAPSMESHLRPD